MKRVVIHIDRLMLRGFRRQDRHAIAAGLQRELARVFGDPTMVSSLRVSGDAPELRVSGVHVEDGSTLHGIGEDVARGIGREITR